MNFGTTTSGGGARNVKLTSVTGGRGFARHRRPERRDQCGVPGRRRLRRRQHRRHRRDHYGGTITATGTARAVDIQDAQRGAGNITLSGTHYALERQRDVIFLDDNAAGTIRSRAPNSVLNGGTSTAVSLTDNTGATINFTGGGLDIDATSGGGFVATGGGTVNVRVRATPSSRPPARR